MESYKMSLSLTQIEREVDQLPQHDIEELFEYILSAEIVSGALSAEPL
jgi:hypothetical protein